jgi:hypothetical protein
MDYVKTVKSLDQGTTLSSGKGPKTSSKTKTAGEVRTVDQGEKVVKGEVTTTWNKAPKNGATQLNPTTPDYEISAEKTKTTSTSSEK